MAKLKRKGWINQSKDSYVCHQVIQEVVRKKLKPTTKKCERIINSFVDKLYIDVNEGEHIAFKKQFMPFAESILKHIKEKNRPIGFLHYRLGSAVAENGDYKKSLLLYEKTDTIFKSILPEYSYELSNLYNSIGISYRHLHQYDESIRYFQKSITIKEKLIEEGDKEEEPRISVSYQNLAVAYRYKKEYDLCIENFQKAIRILEQYGDEYLLALAAFYMNTGSAYRHIKNYEKSIEYLQRAIDIYEDKVGLEHPDLATTYNNLAYAYSDLGLLDKNLEYTHKTVRIYEKHLEPTHPYLLISYSNLALAFFDNERFIDAKYYIDHVVDVRKKTLVEDDIDLVNVLEWQKRINAKIAL